MGICAHYLKAFATFEGVSLPFFCTPTSACWCSLREEAQGFSLGSRNPC